MYHHLKHALRQISLSVTNDLNQDTWFAINNRVCKAINDPKLMVEWRAVFDYVALYNIDGGNYELKHLTYVGRTDTSLARSRHDYTTTCKDGKPCWVDGLCSGTQHLIPDFTDNIPLGAVLAGIDAVSTQAAWVSLNDYKAHIGKKFAETLDWFKNSVLTRYQKESPDATDLTYLNRSLSESLKEFNRTTENAFGNRKIAWRKEPLPLLIFPNLQFVSLAVTDLLSLEVESEQAALGAHSKFLAVVNALDEAITQLNNLDPADQAGF